MAGELLLAVVNSYTACKLRPPAASGSRIMKIKAEVVDRELPPLEAIQIDVK
jgi:hypothetical protein